MKSIIIDEISKKIKCILYLYYIRNVISRKSSVKHYQQAISSVIIVNDKMSKYIKCKKLLILKNVLRYGLIRDDCYKIL